MIDGPLYVEAIEHVETMLKKYSASVAKQNRPQTEPEGWDTMRASVQARYLFGSADTRLHLECAPDEVREIEHSNQQRSETMLAQARQERNRP